MAKERVEVSLQITRLLTLGLETYGYPKGNFTTRLGLIQAPLTVRPQVSADRTLGP